MRFALALVFAIIATVHNAGASAQKATAEVRTLSGERTFSRRTSGRRSVELPQFKPSPLARKSW